MEPSAPNRYELKKKSLVGTNCQVNLVPLKGCNGHKDTKRSFSGHSWPRRDHSLKRKGVSFLCSTFQFVLIKRALTLLARIFEILNPRQWRSASHTRVLNG